MKNYIFSLVIFTVFLSLNLEARNDKLFFPIDGALTQHVALINPYIKLYFATQPPDNVIKKNFGEYKSNKTTNARFKPPSQSCDWVFISAVKDLQAQAVKLGGDAVVNIHSYFNEEMFSESLYECHDGKNVSRVYLRGTVVKLEG